MSPKGFTLTEVLVTLALTSVTLMSITASQIYAQQLARFSFQEAKAYSLLQFMAGHIQSNPVAASHGIFQHPASPTPSCYQTTGCTAEELAKHAVHDWQQQIEQALPSGTGKICPPSPPANIHCNLSDKILVLSIRWQAPSGEHSIYQPVSF